MSKIKIEFLGKEGKRYYRGDGLSCDIKNKNTCIVEVEAQKAAQLMVDYPNEWRYITRKGEEVISKQITDYQNKIIATVESSKGVVAVDNTGKKTEVKPKAEEKPKSKPIPPKPKTNKGGK